MKHVKRFFVTFFLVTGVLLLASCNKEAEKTYYFAAKEATQNSSWVSYVTVEKTGDRITDAHWSAFHIEGDTNNYQGLDKYQSSVIGTYDMYSTLWWHEQADALVKTLIERQNVNEREPLPAGATIGNDDFYELVELALSKDPIPKGEYQDGYHFISNKTKASNRTGSYFYDEDDGVFIKSSDFEYYTFANFIVVNGTIVHAYYNSAFSQFRIKLDSNNAGTKIGYRMEDGVPVRDDSSTTVAYVLDATTKSQTTELTTTFTEYKTKNQLGFSYAMKKPNGPGNFEYFETAQAAAQHVVENQGWKAVMTDGKTDAVAGVTITATDFQTIANRIPKK